MADDISIKLKLDGEKEMRSGLKDLNGELKLMQSELKLVETATKGEANSVNSLQQKVSALEKVSEAAAKKQQSLAKYVEEAKQKQAEAKKAVDDLKASGTANAEQIAKAEQAYQNLTNRVNYWETELNKATEEQIRSDKELEKAKGYLEEAKDADDALAKSIDKYGNEVKESTKETEGLNKQVNALTKMEAVSKLADKASSAFKKMNSAAKDAARELDDGYDTIIKKTGATGKELDEFKDIADDLFGSLPVQMDEVGSAVGEVSTRFKLTGNTLKDVSGQFVKFAKVNGTDVSNAVDTVQKSMTAFGVSTSDAGKVLDVLNRVGQNTGVNISTLTSSLSSNAAAFKQLGLDIYQSAEFMGELEVSGADASSVLTGLKKALKNATDQGKPLNEALADLEDTIVNGTSDMDGLSAAYEIFGTKSGAAVFEAVKNGQISFTDLADSTSILADATDNLNATYDATLSSWDQWTIAENNLKIAGAELSETFQGALAPAAEVLTGVIQDATSAFKALPEEAQTTIAIIAGIGGKALEVAPQIASMVTQIAALKIARTVSGSTTNLSASLKKVGSAAGIASIAIAGAVIAYQKIREEADKLAAAQKNLYDSAKVNNEAYQDTHHQIQSLINSENQYITTEEKRAQLESMLSSLRDTQIEAERQYNDARDQLNNSSGLWLENLQKERDEYGLVNMGLGAVIASYSAADEQTQALNDTMTASQETMQATEADMAAIEAELAAMDAAEAATADTVVTSEAAMVDAKNASITATGEELDAFNNLTSYSKSMASDVADAILSMQASITGSIQSQISWFDAVEEKQTESYDVMVANLQGQIDAIKDWEANLAFLSDKAINQELLQYLADMGPAGAGYVQALVDQANSTTGDGLAAMNALWEEKLNLEAGINSEAEAVYEGIGAMAAGSEEAFAILADQLNVSAEDCGGNIALGLANGIKAAQDQAEAAAEGLGEDTVDAVASGAEVSSPSRATLKTGGFVAQGMRDGINKGTPGAKSAAENLAKQVISAIQGTATAATATNLATTFTAALVSGVTAAQGPTRAAGMTLGQQVGEGISSTTGMNQQAAQVMVATMVNAIMNGLSAGNATANSAAYQIGVAIASALASGAYNNSGAAWSAGNSVANSAVSGVYSVDAHGAGYDVGTNLAWGVANGIWNNQSAAISAAAEMAARVIATTKSTLKIASPSKVMEELGAYTAQGFEIGFAGSMPDVSQTVAQNINVPDLSYYAGASNTVNEVRVYLGDKELSAIMSSAVIQSISSNNRAYLASNGRRY